MRIAKHRLFAIIKEELLKEFGGDHAMTADEMEEHEISHAADQEARNLVKTFRRDLKRKIGNVWGDDAVERREWDAEAKAVKSVIPKLMAALELPPGDDKNREVKYLVYVASAIQPDFYEPPPEEKAAFVADPSEAGPGTPRRLMGTIPSLGIDLSQEAEISEAYSEEQRVWACAQDDPKFDNMCTGPLKKKKA